MSSETEVAIVGAGPYGLSIAAHLRARGVSHRIFGPAMRNWREAMPAGMHLKSDGFASNLCDPDRRHTLERYCAQHALPYDSHALPVSLATFVAYGLDFQSACVPQLEEQHVTRLGQALGRFTLDLSGGSSLTARFVVVATGISHLEYLPPQLDSLGPQRCSHSSACSDPSRFAGRSVLVLGAGASATDVAVLLHQAGARVELVARHALQFHLPPGQGPRPLLQRMRRPHLGLGPSLRSALYTAVPGLFRMLPAALRLRIVRRHLGPAGGWFIKEPLFDSVTVHEGYTLQDARADSGGALLRFQHSGGGTLERRVDHVIAATGYKASLERLPFLDSDLRRSVQVAGDYPVLSRRFESSVPGLHFVGLLAAGSFGPLMRFALGADYTARRLGSRLGTARQIHSAESAAQVVHS